MLKLLTLPEMLSLFGLFSNIKNQCTPQYIKMKDPETNMFQEDAVNYLEKLWIALETLENWHNHFFLKFHVISHIELIVQMVN